MGPVWNGGAGSLGRYLREQRRHTTEGILLRGFCADMPDTIADYAQAAAWLRDRGAPATIDELLRAACRQYRGMRALFLRQRAARGDGAAGA